MRIFCVCPPVAGIVMVAELVPSNAVKFIVTASVQEYVISRRPQNRYPCSPKVCLLVFQEKTESGSAKFRNECRIVKGAPGWSVHSICSPRNRFRLPSGTGHSTRTRELVAPMDVVGIFGACTWPNMVELTVRP